MEESNLKEENNNVKSILENKDETPTRKPIISKTKKSILARPSRIKEENSLTTRRKPSSVLKERTSRISTNRKSDTTRSILKEKRIAPRRTDRDMITEKDLMNIDLNEIKFNKEKFSNSIKVVFEETKKFITENIKDEDLNKQILSDEFVTSLLGTLEKSLDSELSIYKEEIEKLLEGNNKRQLNLLKRRGEQFVSEEIKEWEKTNSKDIENVYKAKLLEEFMGELQGVLSKFYMDKPTLNKLETLQLENKNLTRRIRTLSNESRTYKQAKLKEAKEQKIEEATKNLSQVEKEKITMILEELDNNTSERVTKRPTRFKRNEDVSLIKNDTLRRRKITEGKKLFEERRKKHNILQETRESNELDKSTDEEKILSTEMKAYIKGLNPGIYK